MRLRFITAAVAISLAAGLLWSGQGAAFGQENGGPATKEYLTPDAQQRFEQLREELRKAAGQVEDAKQRAYAENPLLLRAKEGIDRSEKLTSEAGRERAKVKQFFL